MPHSHQFAFGFLGKTQSDWTSCQVTVFGVFQTESTFAGERSSVAQTQLHGLTQHPDTAALENAVSVSVASRHGERGVALVRGVGG